MDHVPVAIAHDYLTQRGGAERVVVALAAIFPGAPVYTSLYEPDATFPELRDHTIVRSPLDRVAFLRSRHRLALPLLAPAVATLRVDADVTLCSSSGWAHGVRVSGRKVVFCHTPARWLYQPARYLEGQPAAAGVALRVLAPPLRRWDRRAAASAHRYLVISTEVRRRVREEYGIDAEVLPPPVDVRPDGEERAVPGVEPGFFLCVSRLLAYKNVGAVVAAFASLPTERLVVVGTGPLARALAADAPSNVRLAGGVSDPELRWLYRRTAGLLSASYEDFGLTPIEAAAYGHPSGVLRWGGFLDTLVEGETGVYIDAPEPAAVARAVRELRRGAWDDGRLRRHAAAYALGRFAERIRTVVAEETSF